jgi:hypothetical protein
MLESIKRWAAGTAAQGPDWSAVSAWARERGGVFKRARDNQGFVVDSLLDGRAWRLEWGPPQRNYIEGRELRLRMDLGLAPDLQMLLMSRPLMETLERQTFERYTEQMQTQIDIATPEEMRWLVMLPKVPLGGAKDFRFRFGAVAMATQVASAWIDGPLTERLEATASVLADEPPLVLMTLRGRLYLRLQLIAPDAATISAMVDVFECAATQAARLGGLPSESPESWPSTASTAWQTQLQPEPPKAE